MTIVQCHVRLPAKFLFFLDFLKTPILWRSGSGAEALRGGLGLFSRVFERFFHEIVPRARGSKERGEGRKKHDASCENVFV